MTAHEPSLKDQIAAALDWWREAGVDADFSDDATDWLAKPDPSPEAEPAHTAKKPPAQEEKPLPPPLKELIGETPPSDLAAFQTFWMEDPGLAVAGSAKRLAPRGAAGAKLMILVATPEPGDEDTLLSGPQGRLLTSIVAAMGFNEDDIYLASVVPQAMPLADGQELLRAGFARVLVHHVSLVRPEQLLVFGTNILPLLGHDAAQQPETVHHFEASGENIPLCVAEGLDALLGMPRLKARFWRRWLAHRAG